MHSIFKFESCIALHYFKSEGPYFSKAVDGQALVFSL